MLQPAGLQLAEPRAVNELHTLGRGCSPLFFSPTQNGEVTRSAPLHRTLVCTAYENERIGSSAQHPLASLGNVMGQLLAFRLYSSPWTPITSTRRTQS